MLFLLRMLMKTHLVNPIIRRILPGELFDSICVSPTNDGRQKSCQPHSTSTNHIPIYIYLHHNLHHHFTREPGVEARLERIPWQYNTGGCTVQHNCTGTVSRFPCMRTAYPLHQTLQGIQPSCHSPLDLVSSSSFYLRVCRTSRFIIPRGLFTRNLHTIFPSRIFYHTSCTLRDLAECKTFFDSVGRSTKCGQS